MAEKTTRVHTEWANDLPLPIHHQQKMSIPEVLNKVVQPHGNREGLAVGWLTIAWLSYILSEEDHRMNQVESWAEERLHTLVPEVVRVKDFIYDRPADVLRDLGAIRPSRR